MSAHAEHTPWSEELAAYALGALEPHEVAAFEGHLVDCDRCRGELARLARTVDWLPASVPQVEPAASVRRRILDEVGADLAASRASSASAPTPVQNPRRIVAATSAPAPSLRRTAAPPRDRRPRLHSPAALAAVAVFVALVFFAGFALRGGATGHRRATVAAQALTSAPVSAALVESGGGDWQLQVDHLPALPAGRVYEVWVRKPRGLRPSSLFVLSRDGRAEVVLPQTLAHGDEVLVTQEPAGGSAAPSTSPLLQAQV